MGSKCKEFLGPSVAATVTPTVPTTKIFSNFINYLYTHIANMRSSMQTSCDA